MDISLTIEKHINKDGREFTKLVADIEGGKPMLSDLQVGEILQYKNGARQVREQLNKHINHFKHDIINIKGYPLSNENLEVLQSLGYAKQSITQSESIYLFSHESFCKFIQIIDPKHDCSTFIEQYFGNKKIDFSLIRLEHSFGDLLNNALKNVCSFKTQYYCCDRFFIDFYDEKLKLAIEYDEDYHNYNLLNDSKRQRKIQAELGCHFIRVKKGGEIDAINEIIKYILVVSNKQ